MTALLDGGGNADLQQFQRSTALIIATELGHTRVAQILLERGASPNQEDSNGNTALMLARAQHHDDIAQLLIKHGGASVKTSQKSDL